MSRKIVVLSVVIFVVALLMAGVVWVALSVVQRMNPELNIGEGGYIPEIPAETELCTADRICMELAETGGTRTVPSTCSGDIDDVAALEALGWTRCDDVTDTPTINVDTSDWVEYRDAALGFSLRLPDYIEEGAPTPGLYCLQGENVVTFIRPISGERNLCAFGVRIDSDAQGVTPRVWMESYKAEIEPTAVTYLEKIRNLGGKWEEKRLGERTWTFIEEPEGPGGEAHYLTANNDGTTMAYVLLPDLLLDYGVHDTILSTFEFIE